MDTESADFWRGQATVLKERLDAMTQDHVKAVKTLYEFKAIAAHCPPAFAEFAPSAWNRVPTEPRDAVQQRAVRATDWTEFQEYRKLAKGL